MFLFIRQSRFLVIAPLLVWSMMFWNGLANRHSHIDRKGQVISHAHPFQNGQEEHNHTEEEFIFWDLISNPQFKTVDPLVLIPEIAPIEGSAFQTVLDDSFSGSSFNGTGFLRGPPSIL